MMGLCLPDYFDPDDLVNMFDVFMDDFVFRIIVEIEVMIISSEYQQVGVQNEDHISDMQIVYAQFLDHL